MASKPAAKSTAKKSTRKKTPPQAPAAKPQLKSKGKAKAGTAKRLEKGRRASKYADIVADVKGLKHNEELWIPVPKGVDSEKYRNNIYHATYKCRDDVTSGVGRLSYSRSEDCKHVLVLFEKK